MHDMAVTGTGGDMDEGANVSTKEISNGYLVSRSWNEGEGDKCKYHSEDVYFKDAPTITPNFYKKGYLKKQTDDERISEMTDMMGGKKPKEKGMKYEKDDYKDMKSYKNKRMYKK